MRGLLKAYGIEPPAAAGGFGRLVIRGQLQGDQGRVAVRDLSVDLGDTQVRGALQLSLAGRPRLEGKLAIDRISVDAYLPKSTTVATTVTPARNEKAAPSAAHSPLAWLADFDAAISVAVGRITHGARAYLETRLEVTLEQGVAKIAPASC